MPWDDLQILRSIDEMEQQGAYIGNGARLLEELARGQGGVWHEEMRAFAMELAVLSWLRRDEATYHLLDGGFLVPAAYYLTGP